jgi:hypothetical protein
MPICSWSTRASDSLIWGTLSPVNIASFATKLPREGMYCRVEKGLERACVVGWRRMYLIIRVRAGDVAT